MVIDEAPDELEDDDILEMVNAGLAPITVVDDYLAEFWSQVFTGLTVHRDVAVRTGGQLAVAFRKDNPKLREAVNAWIKKHGKGDGFRNVIERRYLQDTKYVNNAAADAERKKLRGRDRAVPEVRRGVRPRLPADGRPGLPGIDARPERQESGRGDRRDAGHAADRQGAERRRYQAARAEHPRRREVHALHDGHATSRTSRWTA